MRRELFIGLALAAGATSACSFDGGVPFIGGSGRDAGSNGDGGPAVTDGGGADAQPAPDNDVAHLPSDQHVAGEVVLTLDAGDTAIIDTTGLEIEGDVSEDLSLTTAPQLMAGPEVAVLRVQSMSIGANATLAIRGSRPLVIISEGPVSISGLVTASANLERPGPGGFVGGAGPGAGQVGAHDGFRDSGGGGGGAGFLGAKGGDALSNSDDDTIGGAGGGAYLDATLPVLIGGSGGGEDGLPNCSGLPGAGGGAVQITSFTSITVASAGAINAGGGGGAGGKTCSLGDGTGRGGGTGGGSGGAIYLQAKSISMTGRLAANGGGGGAGAGNFEGESGQNGRITNHAMGGMAGGPGSGNASSGGDGNFGAVAAEPGEDEDSGIGNAGGGGGGGGRIVLSTRPGNLSADLDRTSPVATPIVF